jgi:hypothetical protein
MLSKTVGLGLLKSLGFAATTAGTVASAIGAALMIVALSAPFAFGMLFQRINRGDAEQVYAAFYNVAGAQITANYPAVFDTATADGVRVTKPATAVLSLFVGVASRDIADSAYGLFQVYGFRSSAFMTNDTSVAIAAGDILIPVNAQWHLARSAASDGKSGFIVAGESFATATAPAASTKKAFIRAL